MVVALPASRKSISFVQFFGPARQLPDKEKQELEHRKRKMIKDALDKALAIPERPKKRRSV